MLLAIETLAENILSDWRRAGHAEQDFCTIAALHLARPLDLDAAAVAEWVCRGGALPEQRRLDDGFGQPGVTFFHCETFTIEALFWHSGTPAIHQHAFSGAFRILSGRSVHSRYRFAERSRMGRLTFGDLHLEDVELLEEGSTKPIARGSALIHANFHLDSPTVTLVVRTHQGPEPELSYLPPGVCYDPTVRGPDLHKRLRLLDTLQQTGHAAYPACIQAAIDSSDPYDGMAVALRAGARVELPEFLKLTEQLLRRHGPGAAMLAEALIEERRRGILVRMRGSVTDPDLRFFLACLLNFTQRADVLRAMATRYAGMSAARAKVITGAAELIGGDEDQRSLTAAVTEAILDDVPVGSVAQRLQAVWDRPIEPTEAQALENYCRQLLDHPILTPITARRKTA